MTVNTIFLFLQRMSVKTEDCSYAMLRILLENLQEGMAPQSDGAIR